MFDKPTTRWIDTLIEQFPRLAENLKTNTFPAEFLSAVFGVSAETLEKLPEYLLIWVGVYLLCGVITLFLRFKKGQKSLSSVSNQINNVILTWCSAFFIPLLVMMVKGCRQILSTIEPYRGDTGDLIRFLGESLGSIFYLIMAIAGVGFTVWMPISSFLRYLKVHKLGGLPHAIFDIGTGPFFLAVILLAAHYGRRELYALMLVPVILLWIIQRGGYIPASRNVNADTNRAVSKSK